MSHYLYDLTLAADMPPIKMWHSVLLGGTRTTSSCSLLHMSQDTLSVSLVIITFSARVQPACVAVAGNSFISGPGCEAKPRYLDANYGRHIGLPAVVHPSFLPGSVVVHCSDGVAVHSIAGVVVHCSAGVAVHCSAGVAVHCCDGVVVQ